MYSLVLVARVKELKETQRGVDEMCMEMDKIYREGEDRGMERGMERGMKRGRTLGIAEGERRGKAMGFRDGEIMKARKMTLSLARMNMPLDKIAQVAEVDVSVVRQWIHEGRDARPATPNARTRKTGRRSRWARGSFLSMKK